MRTGKLRDEEEEFLRAADAPDSGPYILRLYVTGTTPKSLRAITNLKQICEVHLKGRYQLEVIDIYQRPMLAKTEQIIAAPTLVKLLPSPLKRLIGDLANTERILLGLDLRPETNPRKE